MKSTELWSFVRGHSSPAAVPQGSLLPLLCPLCPFLRILHSERWGEAVAVATVPRSSFVHSFTKHLGSTSQLLGPVLEEKKRPSAAGRLQARSRCFRHKSCYHFPLKTPRPTSGKGRWHKGSLTVCKESSFVFPRRSQNLALSVTCQNKECPCFALRAPSWGCTWVFTPAQQG